MTFSGQSSKTFYISDDVSFRCVFCFVFNLKIYLVAGRLFLWVGGDRLICACMCVWVVCFHVHKKTCSTRIITNVLTSCIWKANGKQTAVSHLCIIVSLVSVSDTVVTKRWNQNLCVIKYWLSFWVYCFCPSVTGEIQFHLNRSDLMTLSLKNRFRL